MTLAEFREVVVREVAAEGPVRPRLARILRAAADVLESPDVSLLSVLAMLGELAKASEQLGRQMIRNGRKPPP